MTERTETIGTALFAGLSLADGLRWSAAVVLVMGLGIMGVVLMRDWTPSMAVPGEAEPVILLELAPLPEPVVLPEQPTPEPELAPEPVAPAPREVMSPDPVAQVPEILPSPEPLVSEPEAVADPAPSAPEPEPIPDPQPEQVIPPPPEASAVRVPVPVTMSAALNARRETAPTAQTQPRRQTVAPREPAVVPPPAVPAAAAPAPSGPSAAEWQAQVLRHLDRHKVYPRAAQRAGEEGVVQIVFSIDAAGRVGGVRVIGSSGSPTLDQAAIDTARNASPVPRPPDGDSGLSLAAAIRFALR